MIVVCTSLLGPMHPGYSPASERGANQGKSECNALAGADVKNILAKFNAPDAKILSITESPIKGFCEVALDNAGRTGIIYLAVDKKYLIVGPLWDIANMSNKTQEHIKKIEDKKRIDITKIPVNDALIVGEDGASRKVIIFTDPDCPYCSQLHQTMKQIVAQRKDIAFYIKFMPLPFHKDAYWKAKSIVCNKSLKMLEDNFAGKEIAKTDCATKEVDDSMKLAASFGISGTPALILPDGRLKVGAMPEAELIGLIDGKK